jgi:phosphate transport system permease protein
MTSTQAAAVYPPLSRRIVNGLMLTLTGLCTLLVVAVLFAILA